MLECNTCHITLSDEDILKYNNICPCCHTQNSFCEEYIMDIKRISTDESFVNAMVELYVNNPIEYQLKIQQFKTQLEQQKQTKQEQQESSTVNSPKCPTCQSKNLKKNIIYFKSSEYSNMGNIRNQKAQNISLQ